MAQRIALYGGSFNPIHNGHIIIARGVAERIELDRVIFLVSARPPHKPAGDLLDAEHRAAMVKLAIADEPGFEFSDFELKKPGPNYTIQTVSHFREVEGEDCHLHWIIGADSLNELTTWYRVEELVDLCRIVTALRPGWDELDFPRLRAKLDEEQIARLKSGVVQTPRIEISSSDIRSRVREGKAISGLVPDAVREYMARNTLYR